MKLDLRGVRIGPLEAEARWWCLAARERYEERIAIMSDGGPVTGFMDAVARVEARLVNVAHASSLASDPQATQFGWKE